ncbi:rod shape-determining protein [Candidatus Parcubacteria bacterium]|nr:rod shape-determining protein [Candidatus Parcubacteria bacterium]
MKGIEDIKKYFNNLTKKFSNDIGIDLGTANTLVYIPGKGVIINEPSVVAVNQKTGQVVAVGAEAKQMLGRTPAHLKAIRPMVDGVISDFEVTEEMIAYLLNKAQKGNKKLLGPRVVVGVPSGITNVESRAVRDATISAGARDVFIVEEPMAAAIGVRMPVHDPVGSMIIDIGGGTTDIAVISLGGIVRSKNLKIAGDKMNEDIINYIRGEFKILIGEKTAEDIKIEICKIVPDGDVLESTVRGRDLVSGLPREVIITESDIREAVAQSIDTIIESTREVMEITPPEIVSDIMKRGISLTGGGALIKGLDVLLSEELELPVSVSTDPLTSVARGTGIILEDLNKYKDVLIEKEDDLPPKK